MSSSQLQRLETGYFSRLRTWLFGYDVFISYKREDGLAYASAIEDALRASDLVCFRDYREVAPGENFPNRIEVALARSQLLLVIGSPLAAHPSKGSWVRREIETYLKKRSRALVINIDKSVDRQTWPALKDRAWIEESADAFHASTPSDSVLNGIKGERVFTRRNSLARWTACIVLTLALSLASAAIWFRASSVELARISDAQQLAARADALREARPAGLRTSLELALEARLVHDNSVVEPSIRAALDVLPPLLADISSDCDGSIADIDPNRRYLAAAGFRRVCIIDLLEKKQVSIINLQEENVKALMFLHNMDLIIASDKFGSPGTYFRRLAAPSWTIDEHSRFIGGVNIIALSGDGKWLGIGGPNGELGVAELPEIGLPTDLVPFNSVPGHRRISLLEMNHDGSVILAGSSTGLEIWNNLPGGVNRRFHVELKQGDIPLTSKPPPALIDSAQDLFIAAYRGEIYVRRLSDLAELAVIPATDVDGIALTSKGWIVAHVSDGLFKAWHRPKSTFVRTDPRGSQLNGGTPSDDKIGISADGEMVLAVQSQPGAVESWASLFKIASGREIARFAHDSYIRFYSPIGSGTQSVTIGADFRIRIWGDIIRRNGETFHSTDTVHAAIANHDATLGAIAVSRFNPQQDFAREFVVEIWDLTTVSRIAEAEIDGSIKALRFRTGDKVRLDIATQDSLWVWADWLSERPIKSIELPSSHDRCEQRLAFATDSSMLLVSSGRQEVWTGTPDGLTRLSKSNLPERCVEALAISPNGSKIALSSMGPQILVLDAKTGREALRRKTDYLVRTMVFSLEGNDLIISNPSKPESDHLGPTPEIQMWPIPDTSGRISTLLDGFHSFAHICLSSDGSVLGTEQGKSAQFWRRENAISEFRLIASQPRAGHARYCSITADNRFGVVADDFGLRVIRLNPVDLVEEAKFRLGERLH